MAMSSQQAVAVRRAAFAAALLAATLTAHAVSGGGVGLARTSPVAWALLILGAALTGRPGARLRPRRRAVTVGLLAAGQAALHVVICLAPWAVGVTSHMHDRLLASPALIAHGVAALALAALLTRVDALLAGAMRVIDAVRRLLGSPRRASASWHAASMTTACRTAWRTVTPRAARGPPGLLSV